MFYSVFFLIFDFKFQVNLTLTEIIYNIRNLKAGGRASDDSHLSDRNYAFIINYYRTLLIKQDLQKGRHVNSQLVQNLGKVKIKKVDPKECNCDIKGCSLYKVETPLPKAIEVDGIPQFPFVGTTTGKPFQRTTYHGLHFSQHSPYTGRMEKWFSLDDDIYIASPNHNLGKHAGIHILAEDPQAANKYKTCECDNNEECYVGMDFEYPMPMAMLDTLYKMMMDTELRFSDQHLSDNTNNGKDDVQPSN